MIYIAAILVSLIGCTTYIVATRSLGLAVPIFDWLAIAIFALLPLVSRRVRQLNRSRLAVLVLATAGLLYLWFFWIIAVLFGEGL